MRTPFDDPNAKRVGLSRFLLYLHGQLKTSVRCTNCAIIYLNRYIHAQNELLRGRHCEEEMRFQESNYFR